ncbi:hypothetical protein BGX38DRAFT_1278310 [Terfezia claveryi]|nr:hypothetical protein BGX38DRAFT_1278310 [Terfezia claveryi]
MPVRKKQSQSQSPEPPLAIGRPELTPPSSPSHPSRSAGSDAFSTSTTSEFTPATPLPSSPTHTSVLSPTPLGSLSPATYTSVADLEDTIRKYFDDSSSRGQSLLLRGMPGELGPASSKVADVAFGPRAGRFQPYVVVEVGFTQEYDDPKRGGLLQDAKHWLEQSKGRVRCVVLVCINEGKKQDDIAANDEAQVVDGCDTDTSESIDGSTHSSDSTIDMLSPNMSDSLRLRHWLPALRAHCLPSSSYGGMTKFREGWFSQGRVLYSLLPKMSAQPFLMFTRMDFGFHPNVETDEFQFPLEPLAAELAGPSRLKGPALVEGPRHGALRALKTQTSAVSAKDPNEHHERAKEQDPPLVLASRVGQLGKHALNLLL